ncbi:MAG: S8 family serine peptidase [Planctomycetes bacterium]|nr:S8 family serine peptidase [Planctomycetota bacterium]
MRRHPLLVALLLAATLPLASGCWPLAPIAALAAGGGGGGGGGGATGASLSGSVITDATVFGSGLALDREPNDSLGRAEPLPSAPAGTPRHGVGATALALEFEALVEGASAGDATAELVTRGALSSDERRHVVGGAAATTHVARREQELLLVRAERDGSARVDVTPRVSGYVKRRFALALPVAPAGAAAAFDALLVLDESAPTTRLLAFDGDDGSALALHDLGRSGLRHLAAAHDLARGRERLFTCDPASGALFEIELAQQGSARSLGALKQLPIAAGGALAALAYDGLFLHVLRADGELLSYDGAFALAGRRPFAPAGEAVRSLVATLDLGLDHWQVEVPAGTTLKVSFAARSADGAPSLHFFSARATTELEEETSAPHSFERLVADGAPLEFELTAGAEPTGWHLAVGTLAGSARYQLALDRRAHAPAPPAAPALAPDALLAERLVASLAALPDARLALLLADPSLPEFVAGRLLLGRRDVAAALTLPPAPHGFSLARESSSPAGHDLVRVAPNAQWRGPAVRTLNGAASQRARRREQSRQLLVAAARLAGASGVAWREPDWIARTLATPNDPGYSSVQEWHYDLLNLPAAWDITTGSSSVVMAIVDTGARDDNVDFAANMGADGYDYISGSNSGDGDGRDPDPFDEGTFNGNSHHGSHCGGTMGARGNNGTQGTGICWDAELMPLRALGTDGNGSVSDISEAIRYAARLSNAAGVLPAQAAGVINLSLGLGSPSTTMRNAITAAINAGSIVCAAAGNDGNGQAVLYPAAFPEVIAVAAVDFDGDVAYYSNTGPEIDIACSGGSNVLGQSARDIWSTVGVGVGGSLQNLAGTSMACAHASGVVGLLLSQTPALTQAEVADLLTSTAVDYGAVGFDESFGHGVVDAAAAVNDATAVLALPTDEIDFGTTGTRLVLQAKNVGGGVLTVTGVTPSSVQTPSGVAATTAWLTLQPLAGDLTWQLVADRTGLVAGDYQIELDVASNGGNDSLLVDLTAGAGGVTDVGDIVIELVADDGVTVVKRSVVSATDGYAFSLAGVARGSYFVRCGVDSDDDGVIGELGEPFGAYPNVADQALLEIGGASLGLDLVLE